MSFSFAPMIAAALVILVVAAVYAFLGSDWAQQRWNPDGDESDKVG